VFRRGVSLPRFFLLFHVKNAALQIPIRQRVEKIFEKSFKKIWK
jgi:hypothetical protein